MSLKALEEQAAKLAAKNGTTVEDEIAKLRGIKPSKGSKPKEKK